MEKKILDYLIFAFGFSVDYDQWEERGWVRLTLIEDDLGRDPRKGGVLIIYDDYDEDTVVKEMRKFLIEYGKDFRSVEFRKLLKLH